MYDVNKQHAISVIVALMIIFTILFFYFSQEKIDLPQINTEAHFLQEGIFKFEFQNSIAFSKNQNYFIEASRVLSSRVLNYNKKIKVLVIFEDDKDCYAAKSSITSSDENNLTSSGILMIANIPWNKTKDKFKVLTLEHELLHIMGVGLKWIVSYDQVNGSYISKDLYPNTSNFYETITGSNSLGIPVEIEGLKGISNIHWEDNKRLFDGVERRGLSDEIMCHSLNDNTVISLLTLNNLKDLGWDINTTGAPSI